MGSVTVPNEKAVVVPARHAYSHSASVGSRYVSYFPLSHPESPGQYHPVLCLTPISLLLGLRTSHDESPWRVTV